MFFPIPFTHFNRCQSPHGPILLKTKTLDLAADRKKIRIWMVDDNPQFCSIVSEALNKSDTVRCERRFHRAETFLSGLQNSTQLPEAVIVDVRMPGISGLEAIPIIKKLAPSLKIIILSAYAEHRYIFDAFGFGASAYLLKTSCSAAQIIDAIRVVTSGGIMMDESIAAILLKSVLQHYIPSEKYGLTEKEMQIVNLISEGLKSKEIAERLHISATTMIPHLKSIFHKLDVHNRATLVAKVIKEDIV